MFFHKINFIMFLLLAGTATTLCLTIPSASALSCAAGTTPATIDCSIPAGSSGNIVNLRDVTDTSNDTKTTTVELDKSVFHRGETAHLTINDFYANLDSTIPDTITAKITSGDSPDGTPLLLTETGSSSSNFVGSFTVPSANNLGVTYSPVPTFAPRIQLTFDNAGTDGNMILADQKLSSDDEVNNGFSTVIESANLTLSNGAALNLGSTQHIVIQYNNTQLGCLVDSLSGCNTDNLSLWISPPSASPFHTFVEVAGGSSGVPLTIDTSAKTFSFDTDLTSIDSSTSGSWLFVLAFDTGGIGGSGGGITHAGFVFDVLAGIGSAEHTVTPPSFGGGSLHYSDGLTIIQGNNKTTFDISKYNQEIPKQVMISGDKVNMTFKTLEGYSPTGVVHMGLYFILPGQDMATTNSIASIVYENNSPVEITDPNNILSNSAASSGNDGKFQYTQFSFIPTKSYDKMSFLVRAWNDHMYSTDARIYDAVDTQKVVKTLPAGVVLYKNFNDLEATLENEGFYKPGIMAHIHDTSAVFNGNQAGSVCWLYDTINHTVTMVISDNNDNELASAKAILQPYEVEKKGDYTFMTFTSEQLNRWNDDQEQRTMGIEAAKAMFMAAENGLLGHRNW